MWLLWLFWLESLAFSGFILWTVLTRPATVPLTGYQQAALLVYGLALVYGLYGLLKFAQRRFASRKAA